MRPTTASLRMPSRLASRWRPLVRRAPPDPTFVAQLIATAEQIPQTRSLQRAATADAVSAYRSHLAPKVPGAGCWTRQII